MLISVKNIEPCDLENALTALAKTYSTVTMNINGYCNLLQSQKLVEPSSSFIPVTDRETLMTGHYGTIGKMKIFVRRNIEDGHIEVEE